MEPLLVVCADRWTDYSAIYSGLGLPVLWSLCDAWFPAPFEYGDWPVGLELAGQTNVGVSHLGSCSSTCECGKRVCFEPFGRHEIFRALSDEDVTCSALGIAAADRGPPVAVAVGRVHEALAGAQLKPCAAGLNRDDAAGVVSGGTVVNHH